MGDLLWFLGFFAGAALLVYILYIMVRSIFTNRGNTLFKGFVIAPKLKKLDKEKFKVVKKMRPDPEDNKHFVDFVIVSDYGVFFIKRKEVRGVVEKAEGREGNFVKYKDTVRFFKDDNAELAKDAEKIKTGIAAFKDVKTHLMTVYPDDTVLKVQSEGFCGNFKDMIDYINGCSVAENALASEVKEEIYKALINRKENM